MEHLGVLKNSLKRVRAFQIELEFGRVGFYRGKPEYSDKNLSEQGREPTTNSAQHVVQIANCWRITVN